MGKDNIKEDLRIRKTRAAIKDALYELTREKTYQEISVMDIAQRAMINRSTFYLHYKDKDALLDALAQEVLEDMNPIADAISEENLRNCCLLYTSTSGRRSRNTSSGTNPSSVG